MTKTPLLPDEASRQLNVKLPLEDADFIGQVLRPALGVGYNAEAIREVISQMRLWFRLPAYVVDRLKDDAEGQQLHLVAYLQALLLRRYEDLTTNPPAHGAAPSSSVKGTSRRPRH